MPDWRQYVRERISRLGLEATREEEIVSELADHLEDCYRESLRLATPEQAAFARVEQQVSDWAVLSKGIRRAQSQEENMNNRTKHLWLPGLVTLMLSAVQLMILTRSGMQPMIVPMRPPYALLLYVQWLAALPVVGALGTYWSRRAGGSQQVGIAAGLFPAWVMSLLFLTMWPVGWLIESIVHQVPARVDLSAVAFSLLNWGLIPGAALLVGALPILRLAYTDPRAQSKC